MTAPPEWSSCYRNARVCVTGGAGFIGSHLCDALLDAGADVVAIDDLSNGRRENLAHVADRVELVEASILDETALDAAVHGAAYVFHQAALGSVPRSLREPLLYQQVNATGTTRVLEASRRHGVRRVIYAASSSAYGDSTELPLRESMSARPMSPYAAAKLAGESMARAYAHCFDVSTVSLRYFNIFGPRQRPDSQYAAVIPRFIDLIRRGESPVIFGDGSQTRDFTYVANAVRANLLAGACVHPLRGEVLNIACGRSYSLRELVETLAMIMGVSIAPTFAPARTGEVERSWADVSRAASTIGYVPLVAFEDGLRRTVDAFGG
jgi:nucleoside-diphosphate-sugar epimerase